MEPLRGTVAWRALASLYCAEFCELIEMVIYCLARAWILNYTRECFLAVLVGLRLAEHLVACSIAFQVVRSTRSNNAATGLHVGFLGMTSCLSRMAECAGQRTQIHMQFR
jgi:hypothetical protein